MDIQITPTLLHGAVKAPPSKSAAHRAILCAALAEGTSILRGVAYSQDIRATIGAVRALGAIVIQEEDTLRITGPLGKGAPAVIDCGESGSTERFLVPIASALGRETLFTGSGRLPQRPLGPLQDVMTLHGARFSHADGMPFSVTGKLTPGRYTLTGNVSSQYVSGLLFALPMLHGDSEIQLTTALESAGYVNMTLDMLRRFGVAIEQIKSGFSIRGWQRPTRADITIEGDWSNGAFWLCAEFLGADVRCEGLDARSVQGDRAVAKILRDFQNAQEKVLTVEASPIPDLVPALCAAAAGRRGVTIFTDAARLRLKECDRLQGMTSCLRALGGQADETGGDTITVTGSGALRGGEVDGCGDHRVVMAAATAALLCSGPVTIRGAQAVEKSYPDFFDRYRALGGKLDVL